MALYETISSRRQVRKFNMTSLETQTLDDILNCALEAGQLRGQHARIELASAERMSSKTAPYYLLGYCEDTTAAYANVGYVLQEADLYIQSMGLGSGWFMNARPKNNAEGFCIALAFGHTDIPVRSNADEFKRKPVNAVSSEDNLVSRAVRLAPSSMNSQPWKLTFKQGKVMIQDAGRGVTRLMLKNKLNKIDIGIAARHAVLALTEEGRTVTSIVPETSGKKFEIEIVYR